MIVSALSSCLLKKHSENLHRMSYGSSLLGSRAPASAQWAWASTYGMALGDDPNAMPVPSDDRRPVVPLARFDVVLLM